MVCSGRRSRVGSRSLLWSIVAMAILGLAVSCGNDNGSPAPTPPLTGTEGIQASSGLIISTITGISSIFLPLSGIGLGKSAESRGLLVPRPLDSAIRIALASSAGEGKDRTSPAIAVLDTCPDGGTRDISCTVDEAGSHIQIVFANCAEADTSDTTTTTLNGTITLDAASPFVCLTGSVPDSVAVTIAFHNVTATVVKDVTSQTIGSINANFSIATVPGDSGCAGKNGTMTVDGSVAVVSLEEAIDVAAAFHSLVIQHSSAGIVCVETFVLNGGAGIQDNTTGRQFSETFENFTVTSTHLDNDREELTLDGTISTNCLGSVVFQTIQSLLRIGSADCPAAGQLRVTLPGNPPGDVYFTKLGGVDFDYDADGAVDRSFASCDDDSIKACNYPL